MPDDDGDDDAEDQFQRAGAARPAPARQWAATYWDKDVKGFGLRITSNGARTFVVQRRPEGSVKPVTVTLDHFTGRNLIAARKLAEQAFSDLKKGKRPRDRKLELKESTLGALAEQFIKAELRSKRQGHQCENVRCATTGWAKCG